MERRESVEFLFGQTFSPEEAREFKAEIDMRTNPGKPPFYVGQTFKDARDIPIGCKIQDNLGYNTLLISHYGQSYENRIFGFSQHSKDETWAWATDKERTWTILALPEEKQPEIQPEFNVSLYETLEENKKELAALTQRVNDLEKDTLKRFGKTSFEDGNLVIEDGSGHVHAYVNCRDIVKAGVG
jgi:hypothetical protein